MITSSTNTSADAGLVTPVEEPPAITIFPGYQPNAGTADTQTANRKRGRYVARACWDCQRRKVKCSGEQPCRHCRVARLECLYSSGRFRKQKTRDLPRQDVPRAGSNSSSSNGRAPEVTTHDLSTWKSDVLARIASLEKELEVARRVRPTDSPRLESSGLAVVPPGSVSSRELQDNSPLVTDDEDNEVNHARPRFQSGTDLVTPISILERTVEGGGYFQETASTGHEKPASLSRWRHTKPARFSGCCDRALQLWDPENKDEDIETLRNYINTYFICMNKHHLGIDEDELLSRFERYLAQDYTGFTSMDLLQTVALVRLMVAVVKILDEYCINSKHVPGWEEFAYAKHLLGHTMWLGNGDFRTIQCLHLETLYCLFIERTNAAAESMSAAVRLSYQLGLHDQNSWQSDHDQFPPSVRRRLFWCLYCLDRQVALYSGMPYMIRESDFRVDQPSLLDVDSNKDGPASVGSGHGELSPLSLQYQSSIPYSQATIKWAKLCSEIWDAMFGITATKPPTQDFVVAMDARILLLIQDLPAELRWRPEVIEHSQNENLPLYVYRQSIIINVRANHLRLLLRRQDMMTLAYHERTAEACITIATQTINAISTFHASPLSQRTDRYSSASFLAGAMLPLICIIVKEHDKDKVGAVVVAAFQKALALLQDISRGLTFARRMLHRLGRLIEAANRVIMGKSQTDVVQPPEDEQWLADTFASLDQSWFALTDDQQLLSRRNAGPGQDLVDNSFLENMPPGVNQGGTVAAVGRDYEMNMFDLMY
ncbi:hypothetical protein A1O3_02944 [Capronia epimyces CBS 606.96]|uniref:Zn(2)-C6 fungal-type domain-containing protein n=1 Tax=Capronia epimyces CBS 606.96 TaxID=1182542 RepID=W9YAM8_9EURO|nr:uncharacterized protein A1O3_02944 [Capronia epimyces CBS 606.96]EXJ89877.1 hypothetical protein A1O3_02944 [Capronia epimyces CBS 606.96]